MRFAPTALALALATGVALGQSQQVYRCGPDGRELSQQPCGVGQSTPLPSPSAAERAAATERVRREAQLADGMERERLAREQAQTKANAHAINIGPAPATAATSPHAKPVKKTKPKKKASPAVKPPAATSKSP